MTSRIWLDVRDDECDHVAWVLERVGFKVERFFPVQRKQHESLNEVETPYEDGTYAPAQIEFPAGSRVWVHNHQSLPEADSLPTDEEWIRLLQWLRRYCQSIRKNSTCMDATCEPPVVKSETPNVKCGNLPTERFPS